MVRENRLFGEDVPKGSGLGQEGVRLLDLPDVAPVQQQEVEKQRVGLLVVSALDDLLEQFLLDLALGVLDGQEVEFLDKPLGEEGEVGDHLALDELVSLPRPGRFL